MSMAGAGRVHDPSGPEPGLASDLRSLLSQAWAEDRRGVLTASVLLVLAGVLSLAAMGSTALLVQALASAQQIDLAAATSLRGLPVWALLVVFVLAGIAQAAVTRASSVLSVHVQLGLTDTLRSQAYAAVLAASWEHVLQARRSEVLATLTAGASRCGVALQLSMQLAVTLVLMLSTAAVALVAVAGYSWIAFRHTVRPAHQLGQELSRRTMTMMGEMTDALGSLRLVRAHDAAEGWTARLLTAFDSLRASQLALVRRQALIAFASSAGLVGAALALVLVAVATGVPGPTVVVLVVLLARLSVSARSAVQVSGQLAQCLPAVHDLRALTERARAAREPRGQAPTERPRASAPPYVRLRDVAYGHPGGGGVQQISLEIPAGQLTVLTGPSGAGKSTTADLLLGLLVPQRGAIEVDGATLGTEDLVWWRSRLAFVPQEPSLLPGTLRDNLTWSAGRPVDDEECWSALAQVRGDFARGLDAGLDTRLGDAGVRLSGGERQRVALAAALLRRPQLLVLDEATSALDDETESAVVAAVRALSPSVTVLAIAHRRSLIEAADHVVEIRGGRVVHTDAVPGSAP